MKASDNEFPSLLLVEGAAPATPGVGLHRLFVDSADGLLKRKDDAGTVSTVEGGGGGGGADPWDLVIDDPLTDLSGWTTSAGWADGGAYIEQTAVDSKHIAYATKVPLDQVIAECEFAITAGGGSSRIGFALGMNNAGAVNNAFAVTLQGTTTDTTQLDFEQAATSNFGQANLPAPVAFGATWMKLRVKRSGNVASVWLDGVFITSFQVPGWGLDGQRLGFYNYNAAARARNLKVWTPALPA